MTTHPAVRAPVTHRAVLAIAAPVMISNVSTPLLGVVEFMAAPDPGRITAQRAFSGLAKLL